MKKWIGLLALLMLALVCATALGETNTQVKHYLMLGEDGYAEHVTDDARTDTIVLVSLDTKYNRVILTSILRDSKINNPRGNETKINLLYKNHGFSGIISCLERELDIQIEGAILVNFENVKPVIDALGGVDIEIEYLAIRSILLGKDPNMPDGPGLVHMTGRIALAYMRTRSTGSGAKSMPCPIPFAENSPWKMTTAVTRLRTCCRSAGNWKSPSPTTSTTTGSTPTILRSKRRPGRRRRRGTVERFRPMSTSPALNCRGESPATTGPTPTGSIRPTSRSAGAE